MAETARGWARGGARGGGRGRRGWAAWLAPSASNLARRAPISEISEFRRSLRLLLAESVAASRCGNGAGSTSCGGARGGDAATACPTLASVATAAAALIDAAVGAAA